MLSSLLSHLNHINPHKPKTNYLKIAKIILAIFILISITLKIIPILAQESEPTEPDIDISAYDQWVENMDAAKGSISSENWSENQTESLIHTTAKILMGDVPTTAKIQQSISQNGVYLPGGMLGTTNNLIAQTYHQPASGVQYLAQLKDNLLGKPVYAQGFGFIGLEPLLPIWRGFRNVVYLLSTVYFIVLGIMVMFRLKINPQTVLTVQSAIPQVITTLLLVTFSYAIAGLLIDLTYLIQSIVLALLFQVQGKGLNENLVGSNLFKLFNFKNLSDAGLMDFSRLTRLAIPKNLIYLLGIVIFAIVGGAIGLIAGANPVVALATTLAGGATGAVIVLIVINLILFISLLKFFFGVLKAYVNIIFKIILAPLEIGLGAVPGMKIGFSSWANNLFANLLIFPICLLFLVLANIIIGKTSGIDNLWAPTIIKYNLAGQLARIAGGVTIGIIPTAVGFMTVLIMSKLPEIIPQVFFAIKPSGLETAIGQATQLENIPLIGKPISTIKQGVERQRQEQYAGYWKQYGPPSAVRWVKNKAETQPAVAAIVDQFRKRQSTSQSGTKGNATPSDDNET